MIFDTLRPELPRRTYSICKESTPPDEGSGSTSASLDQQEARFGCNDARTLLSGVAMVDAEGEKVVVGGEMGLLEVEGASEAGRVEVELLFLVDPSQADHSWSKARLPRRTDGLIISFSLSAPGAR